MKLGDQMKEKLGEGVIVLASAVGRQGQSLMAMATEGACKAGRPCRQTLIKGIASLVGGGGGGRPNMAQAGGKNPAGIDDAIGKVQEVLEEQLVLRPDHSVRRNKQIKNVDVPQIYAIISN